MGTCTSKTISKTSGGYTWKNNDDDPSTFIHKVHQLEQEINLMLQGRVEESEAYERELLQFALREAGWKKERKRLREEVRRLRRSVVEKEEKIRLMEDEVDQIVVGKCGDLFEGKSSVETGSVCVTAGTTGSSSVMSMSLMEHMKEERLRRDETVVKWKKLYLVIKNELDELIHKTTTHQVGMMYQRADGEDTVEKMQIELKAKDEIIEILKAQIISMENNEYTRKREVDILRQSLKIMSNKKVATLATYVKKRRSSKGLIRFNKSLTKFTFVNQM